MLREALLGLSAVASGSPSPRGPLSRSKVRFLVGRCMGWNLSRSARLMLSVTTQDRLDPNGRSKDATYSRLLDIETI